MSFPFNSAKAGAGPRAARQRSGAGGRLQTVAREQSASLDLAIVKGQHLRECHLTLRPLAGENVPAMLRRLYSALRRNEATLVKLDVFGSLAAHQGTLRALKEIFGKINWPVTWVDGADCVGGPIAGLHALAIHGAEIEPVLLGNRRVGSVFNAGTARHCWLGDLRANDVSQSAASQSEEMYANMETALAAAGMNMTNVVRTWLFLDDILAWYDQFNQVRREFYREQFGSGHLVPASTGVGAKNPAGSAVLASAWAVQAVNGDLQAREVASPLQCPAPSYGSCFSRAVELTSRESRYLLISGTASIAPDGRSTHAGDVTKQVDLTMQVVHDILESRGLSFPDASRVTAYFKHPQDAPAFIDWCAKHDAAFLPAVVTRSDVCRDELLFEIEMDAIAPVGERNEVKPTAARKERKP